MSCRLNIRNSFDKRKECAPKHDCSTTNILWPSQFSKRDEQVASGKGTKRQEGIISGKDTRLREELLAEYFIQHSEEVPSDQIGKLLTDSPSFTLFRYKQNRVEKWHGKMTAM